jgi:uncharacterized membrane protein YphA (DoxX/SURF4 family)
MSNTQRLTGETGTGWSFPVKLLFRFFFIFWLLLILPFPLGSLPFIESWNQWLSDAYERLWQLVAVWMGKRVLHLANPITIFANGSGDTTYNYVKLLSVFCIAAAGALTWSIADRRRAHYRCMHYWLRLSLRYYLASVLISYGLYKIFYLQMPAPGLLQLIQPFGDKSPMGLAWSYVGYSKAFSIITGWAEVMGGLLLIFGRTVLTGVLLNLFVTGNIVVINFCYDVPVKLFSSTLWLMNCFLLAPHLGRLVAVLVWNKPVAPVAEQEYVSGKWRRWGRIGVYLFFACTLVSQIGDLFAAQKRYGSHKPKPPLYGIYNTQTFTRNKDTVPLLLHDASVWHTLVIEYKDNAAVKLMNDQMAWYSFKTDTASHSIAVRSSEERPETRLSYEQRGDRLVLRGMLDRDTVEIRLTRMDEGTFRLTSRGFHWINEYPYNY